MLCPTQPALTSKGLSPSFRILVLSSLLALPLLATYAYAADPAALVPLPAQVTWKSGDCPLPSEIYTDGACKQEGELLAAMLHARHRVHSGAPPASFRLATVDLFWSRRAVDSGRY